MIFSTVVIVWAILSSFFKYGSNYVQKIVKIEGPILHNLYCIKWCHVALLIMVPILAAHFLQQCHMKLHFLTHEPKPHL